MLPCLPLFLGIRVQEPLLVGFINLELSGFLACLGKRRIIEFLLHKQIGILRLQEIDGGQFFQRQLVKRFLRCLVDDEVTLMRIVGSSGNGRDALAPLGDADFQMWYWHLLSEQVLESFRNNITISGGEVKAIGDRYGAGIGGGSARDGSDITISGGEVKAIGGVNGAGIGGGLWGKGKDITVSGAAKLKVPGGVEDDYDGVGAGIGDGGSNADGSQIPGTEVEPDTSGLTTGRIEYYAPGADMENDTPTSTTTGTSSQPEKPIEPSAERGMDAPLYRMTDKYDRDIAYTAEQTGGVLTVTVDEDFAVLTGSLSGITALRAQGVEKLVFVTKGATSAFMLSDLLEKGESGEAYWLTHDGKAVTFTLGEGMADVSAILTKPQAKSQKPCRRADTSCVCPPCLPKSAGGAQASEHSS